MNDNQTVTKPKRRVGDKITIKRSGKKEEEEAKILDLYGDGYVLLQVGKEQFAMDIRNM